jgi:hypothetical protein
VKNFQGINPLFPFFVQYNFNTSASEENPEEKSGGDGVETKSSTNAENRFRLQRF